MTRMSTNAEMIGAGSLWRGVVDPGARIEVPRPLVAGTPIGPHLRVRRLARMMPGRALYVVDNVGPKWTKRKCWNCGNIHNTGQARICSYCGTPLRDTSFLMSQRWDEGIYSGVEQWTRSRLFRLGIISPVALIYRQNLLHTVYHYNSESLLIDEPAPLPGEVVLSIGVKLAEGLVFLHDNGALLRGFGTHNVVVMPDGSVRWFDLDLQDKLAGLKALHRHADDPIPRDTAALGRILLPFCDRRDEVVTTFCQGIAHGSHPTPVEFINAAEGILRRGRDWNFDPDAHAMTDVGLMRTQNEDAWGWHKLNDKISLFVVADGMGGHAKGEVASSLATARVTERLMAGLAGGKPDDKKLEATVKAAMLEANDAVHKAGKAARAAIGTTLIAAVVVDGKTLHLGHAGDCRAYLHRKGVLKQLTKDHTLVQELLEDGQITETEARDHPRKNVVTVTVGGFQGELDSEHYRVDLKPGDRILLCTDGLWGSVEDMDIEDVLTEHDDRRVAMQTLFRKAFSGGSNDNVTALIIDV